MGASHHELSHAVCDGVRFYPVHVGAPKEDLGRGVTWQDIHVRRITQWIREAGVELG